MGDDLIRMTARVVVEHLARREVSPLELIDAALARIDAVDGAVNALPVRCADRARDHARRLMAAPMPTDRRGWLGGLPLAIKDSMDVAGVRSTQGSPIFANHVPARSDLQVEALEAQGGIVLARSNAPEFAAGANTFNEVFGKTRNPWNTTTTCGGSSGGSAVALATGEVWLANGSDLGGSLRIPASFCSVVGLRPSPGLVPHGPKDNAFDGLGVSGPMARDIGDLALMLDAMARFDPRDPLSHEPPARSFVDAVAAPKPPRRVGFSADLGFLPIDPEVRDIAAAAAGRFAELGGAVEENTPDFRGAAEIFQTLRAVRFVASYAPLLREHRALLKPEVVWNIEKGQKLDAETIGRATRERVALYGRVAAFFAEFDLLATPTVIVPPFNIEERYVTEVAGHRFDNYVDWLGMTYAVTLTECPALSMPCGFTRSGLPVGLQLVGRPRGEAALLGAAALLEAALAIGAKTPIDPRPGRG
ncbi:MAG TPA: amidase family protein [Stellaceae bacterium]|nr:amidase family protein [Stellaceae bacterium]